MAGAAGRDAAATCGMDFDAAIALFSEEASANLVRRQCECLRQLARLNRDGYWVNDLAAVRRLLELAVPRLGVHPVEIAPPLCSVISCMSRPLRFSRANEEYQVAAHMRGLLATLADLLRAGEPRVELAACEALLEYSKAVPRPGEDVRLPGDGRPSKWSYHNDLIRTSGAIPLIVAALRSEVEELVEADVDGDGSVDMAEFYRFRVLNDGLEANDDDTLDDALARAAITAGAGPADASAGGRPYSATSGRPSVPTSSVLGDEYGDGRAARRRRAARAAAKAAETSAPPEEEWKSAEFFLDVVVRLTRILSEHAACADELTANGTPAMCLRIMDILADWRQPVVASCMEVLWNLLEQSALRVAHGVALSLPGLLRKHRTVSAGHMLTQANAMIVLHRLFERVMYGAFSAKDKALRNTIVIISTILARIPSAPRLPSAGGPAPPDADAHSTLMHLISSGFLDTALMFATTCEAGTPVDADLSRFATPTDLDLELKLLLWELISTGVRMERDLEASQRAFLRLRHIKDRRLLGVRRNASVDMLSAGPSGMEDGEDGEDEGDRGSQAVPPSAVVTVGGDDGNPDDDERRMVLEGIGEEAGGGGGDDGDDDGEDGVVEEPEAADGHPAGAMRELRAENVRGGPILTATQDSSFIPVLLTYLDPIQEKGASPEAARTLFSAEELQMLSTPMDFSPAGGEGAVGGADEFADDMGASVGLGADGEGPTVPPNPYIAAWSGSQKRTIEIQAFSILRLLAPLSLRAFVDTGGPQILTLYLREHTTALASKILPGASNDMPPPAGTSSAAATVRALRAMRSVDADRGKDDPPRQYCTLRLIQAVAGAGISGAAVAAEFVGTGIMEDIVGLFGATESTIMDAMGISGAAEDTTMSAEGVRAMTAALAAPIGAGPRQRGKRRAPGVAVGAADGAADPDSGGPIPAGMMVEALCATLWSLCGGPGMRAQPRTSEESDAEETGMVGGATVVGRAIFAPAQDSFRQAKGIARLISWLRRLTAAFRNEVYSAHGRPEEAQDPATTDTAKTPPTASAIDHCTLEGRPSKLLPAAAPPRVRAADTLDDDAVSTAAGGAGGSAGRVGSRPGTARSSALAESQTLLRRADVAGGGGSGGGGGSKTSTARGGPDHMAQLSAAVVAALWSAVADNPRSIDRLVADDGVDALVDWLEVAPMRERPVVLGILADVAAVPASRPLFAVWRSERDGSSVAALLMRLWQEEEARLGVAHGPHGVIVDVGDALREGIEDEEADTLAEIAAAEDGSSAGAFDRLREAIRAAQMWANAGAGDKGGASDVGVVRTRGMQAPSLEELVGLTDLRSKVFAVLDAIGWDDVTQNAAAGDVGEMPLSQLISLELAREYGVLRWGQAWSDLYVKLCGASVPASMRVEPCDQDAEAIEMALSQAREAAERVRERQVELVSRVEAALGLEESKFFDQVLASRDAERKAMLLVAKRTLRTGASAASRRAATARAKALMAGDE